MKKTMLALAALLAFTLPTAPPALATSCANQVPAGSVITPACTWIVEQVDPGVWKDNQGDYWVHGACTKDGVCSNTPVKVKLEDLRIGEWRNAK